LVEYLPRRQIIAAGGKNLPPRQINAAGGKYLPPRQIFVAATNWRQCCAAPEVCDWI